MQSELHSTNLAALWLGAEKRFELCGVGGGLAKNHHLPFPRKLTSGSRQTRTRVREGLSGQINCWYGVSSLVGLLYLHARAFRRPRGVTLGRPIKKGLAYQKDVDFDVGELKDSVTCTPQAPLQAHGAHACSSSNRDKSAEHDWPQDPRAEAPMPAGLPG